MLKLNVLRPKSSARQGKIVSGNTAILANCYNNDNNNNSNDRIDLLKFVEV